MPTANFIDVTNSATWSTADHGTVAITTTVDNDVIVLEVAAEQSAALAPSGISVSTISDTAGLTWAKRSSKTFTSNAGRPQCIEVWWAKKPTAGATTITATLNVSIDDACLCVGAFKNIQNPSSPWTTDASCPAITSDVTGSAVTQTRTISTAGEVPLVLTFSGGVSRPIATGFTSVATAQNTGGVSAMRAQIGANQLGSPASSLAVATSTSDANTAWLVDALVVETEGSTSYNNLGGSGPRASVFAVTSTLPKASGSSSRADERLIDGVLSTTNKPFMTTGTAASGKTIEFLLTGLPRVIDGYKWYQAAPVSSSIVLAFEGYNGSTWDTLDSGTSPSGSGGINPTVVSFTNTTEYQKYRFREVSGTWNDSNIWQIEFRISGVDDECGPRETTITASTDLTSGGGTASNLVDGAYGSVVADAWFPTNAAAVSGKEIKFQFATPRVVKYARTECTAYSGTLGVFKWQGSNDGSTWTDIGSSFTWTITNPSASVTSAGVTPPQDLSSNTTAYSYYRMVGVSGNTNSSPWYLETYFDIYTPPLEKDLAVSMIGEGVMTVDIDTTLSEVDIAAAMIGEGSVSAALQLTTILITSMTGEGALEVTLTNTPAEVDIESSMSGEGVMSASLDTTPAEIDLAVSMSVDNSVEASLTITPDPVHLAVSMAGEGLLTGAVAILEGPGPFYFAWVDETETTFVSSTMLREDEDVFGVSISQDEGDFANMSLTIRNPRIGLLNPTRKVWVWYSHYANGVVTPLFFGRLVGIPSNIFDTQITVQFTARPLDFNAQKAALAETMRVLPFWDPIFISPDKWEDDDLVLEARSEAWHIDRVTHVVTSSDIIIPEDGVIELQESDHFRDGLQVNLNSVPLRRVTVNASISWNIAATGGVDVGSEILRKWPRENDKYQLISTFTLKGLISEWPKYNSKVGTGWTADITSIEDESYHTVPIGVPPDYLNGEVLPTAVPDGSLIFRPILITRWPWWSKYWYSGVLIAADNISTNQDSTAVQDTIAVVPIGFAKPTLIARYTVSRPMQQNVAFTLVSDMQPITTLASDDESLLITLNSNPVTDISRDGNITIDSPLAPTYVDSPRGQQSVQHLVLLARANLVYRARAVQVTCAVKFEDGIAATLRKGLLIHDRRLPSGQATGKLIKYSIDIADGTGVVTLTIGCSVGYGGALTEDPGEPCYIDDYFIEGEYQQYSNAVTLIPTSDVTWSLPPTRPFDDGIDFRKGLTKSQAIQSLIISGGPGVQRQALTVGQVEFGDTGGIDAILQQYPTQIHLKLLPMLKGPFQGDVPVTVSNLVIPKQIDLEAASND